MLGSIVLLMAPVGPTHYFDGEAVGFPKEFPHFWISYVSINGKRVESTDLAEVDKYGEWTVAYKGEKLMKGTQVAMTIRAPGHLKSKLIVRIDNPKGPVFSIKLSDLIFGDIDGNNVINEKDVDIVKEALGVKLGDPQWTEDMNWNLSMRPGSCFDFNKDNAVDEKDLAIVQANLGKRGA